MTDAPLVLCADDDEDILALLSLRLERAGYRVVCATDGERALELAQELCPDVAVLDVMMPRRTGTEIVRELRAAEGTKEMRIILLSARVQQGDIESGIEAGADAYLPKPFRAVQLVELVEELLARGR